MGKKFQPIQDRVVIQPIHEDVTQGGVIIPDTSQDGILQGTVIAVGPGLLLITGEHGAMQCKPGDVVYYSRMTAQRFDDEDNLYVVKESELLTIVK